MRLRWTEEAANDLERIADYLVQNTPRRAQGLIERIYDATGSLLTLPDRGRPGKVKGTRELVLTALPYVVVYVSVRTPLSSSAFCTVRSNGRERLAAVGVKSSRMSRTVAGCSGKAPIIPSSWVRLAVHQQSHDTADGSGTPRSLQIFLASPSLMSARHHRRSEDLSRPECERSKVPFARCRDVCGQKSCRRITCVAANIKRLAIQRLASTPDQGQPVRKPVLRSRKSKPFMNRLMFKRGNQE